MSTSKEQHLISLAENGEVIFFVGSGISTLYPSSLPSASELVKITASSSLPRFVGEASRLAEHIQPEIFYQELVALRGSKALESLNLLSDAGPPTLTHLLIARWAMLSSLPILTTNFDTLLEEAIRRLGGAANAIVPTMGWSTPSGVVSIWKLHGSIEFGPQGVYTTMPRITQPDLSLLREVTSLARKKHLCFIGYSGRDIDLFPLIAAQSGIKQPFWIDLRFNDSTRDSWARELRERADLINAICIPHPLDSMARSYIPAVVSSLPYAGTHLDPEELRTQSNQEVKDKIEKFRNGPGKELALSRAEQEFFLARCYLRTGRPKRAEKVLALGEVEHAKDEFLRVQAHLLRARLLDSISNYDQSESQASAALTATRKLVWNWPPQNKALALRIQALHSYAMARKMQIGPSIEYSQPELSYKPRTMAGLKIFFLYMFVLARMRGILLLPALASRKFSHLRSPTSNEDSWLLEGWAWYLDHFIIFLGFLRKLLRPERLSVAVAKLALTRLRNAAIRAGDSFAMANTEKELKRIGLRTSDETISALKIYELITNPLNKALIHRNEAENLLRSGQIGPAAEEFRSCFNEARRCGSYATMLKAVAGLKACGDKVPRRALSVFECRITGQGYQDYISKLKRVRGF